MIKATIQNSPYCTEITFPCSETELSKKLGELGMNLAHLSPMATVIEIEPSELSVLEDCEVSLDALNYLGKRLDGMDELEQKRFLAALSCEEAEIGYGLKNIINLTYNLEHFTLIEDTSDLEKAGLTHMLVIRGGLSVTESQNKDWLIAEGRKLLDSGKGIDTGYGTLFINEEFPFRDVFNGTTFPAYYCESNSVLSVELGFSNQTELVELPCEEVAIKKALCRLGADDILDCKVEVDSSRNISDEQWEKIREVEKTKDVFGLNKLLQTEYIQLKSESIFNKEVARILRENGYTVSESSGYISVFLDGKEAAKIFDNGMISAPDNTSDDTYFEIKKIAGTVSEYCSAYEKAAPLKAEDLSGNYRCLSEFNGTILAAKYNAEYGFEFVTWDRTFDSKAVCQGNYYTDYAVAKENFAVRSGMVDKDKIFGTKELEQLEKCVNFAMRHNGDLKFDDCEFLKKISEKISENIPEQQQNEAQEMSM